MHGTYSSSKTVAGAGAPRASKRQLLLPSVSSTLAFSRRAETVTPHGPILSLILQCFFFRKMGLGRRSHTQQRKHILAQEPIDGASHRGRGIPCLASL